MKDTPDHALLFEGDMVEVVGGNRRTRSYTR